MSDREHDAAVWRRGVILSAVVRELAYSRLRGDTSTADTVADQVEESSAHGWEYLCRTSDGF